ncbi:MAG: restriction endonuclease subunit S [Sphingobacteriales bacterium]|jgi:type I restriction enzyme S subunit|nr:restriction endonuclease subunit S [Sphingobacteriales bacterium]
MKNEELKIKNEWRTLKLKYFLNIQKGKVPAKFSNEAISLPYLSMEFLRKKSNPFYVFPQANLTEVKQNDCLVLWDGANAGEIMKAKNGYLSSTMAVLKPKADLFTNSFFYYFLKSNEDIFKKDANGTTIPHFDPTHLLHSSFLIPSLVSQTAIASFLDHKTTKIDRFIRKKKQLIKLLNEQKAEIINDAVTGKLSYELGMNSNDELGMMNDEFITHNSSLIIMKPSGIEWLGDIPEHWEVRKLKYSVSLNKHTTFDNEENIKNKIALENIEGKTGRILDLKENVFEGVGTIFKKGDVLFGKLRPYLAKVISPNFEGSCVNEILVLTPNKEIWNTEFLKLKMLSQEFIKIVDDSTYGSKMPRASWYFIGGLKISCPPISEQAAIVSHIEKETAKINQTIATIEKEIALVQEYKTALIAEAVTGKIDVSNYELGVMNYELEGDNDELGIMNDELDDITDNENENS